MDRQEIGAVTELYSMNFAQRRLQRECNDRSSFSVTDGEDERDQLGDLEYSARGETGLPWMKLKMAPNQIPPATI